MTDSLKLKDIHLVSFESRFPKAISDLVKIHGGATFSAPTMKEVPLENNFEAFAFAGELFKGEFAAVILLTGVGTRYLIDTLATRHKKEDILDALRKTFMIVRGPKPLRVLNELKVPIGIAVPEPNTWRDILNSIDSAKNLNLKGRVVAVQEYGITNNALIQGLEERGIRVVRVPVYRWTLPDDVSPLRESIEKMIQGQLQVAIFTSATQVYHLFKVAQEMGLEGELKDAFKKTVVASIGPVCSEALLAHHLTIDIEPKIPKMGPLIQEIASHARSILDKK